MEQQFELDHLLLKDDELKQEMSQIPDRFGYKIGDVAKILKLKAYTLRYWESEFSFLSPKKADNQQRYYTKKDIEKIMIIKKLLYDYKFSIEGAKVAFSKLKKTYKNKEKTESSKMHLKQASSCLKKLHLKLQSMKADLSKNLD